MLTVKNVKTRPLQDWDHTRPSSPGTATTTTRSHITSGKLLAELSVLMAENDLAFSNANC